LLSLSAGQNGIYRGKELSQNSLCFLRAPRIPARNDQISVFFRGASRKFKYHMVKWRNITKPKANGGLGILDTQLFTECLITKWIWKISEQPDELWCRLIRAKCWL
jgi:hypothetical protein